MSIKERFFKRRSQTKEIPSGAYEDYLDTKLTGKPSDPDIEGPRTLVDVPPEREKEIVQQEKIPLAEDSLDTDDQTSPGKMEFDPTTIDRRVYSYIQSVALPQMRESQEVLFYLQDMMESGMLGDVEDEKYVEFDDDVDYMINLVDSIMEYLAGKAADAFTKLDEEDKLYDVDFDEIAKKWDAEKEDFKEMLSRVGDPFAQPGSDDPFSSPENPNVSAEEYGDEPDAEWPSGMSEKDLWDMIKRRGK